MNCSHYALVLYQLPSICSRLGRWKVRVGGGILFFTNSSIYQCDIHFQHLNLADRALREG